MDSIRRAGSNLGVEQVTESSRSVAMWRSIRGIVGRILPSSRARRIGIAIDQSLLTSLSASISRIHRDSYCYRWLTKEPEPEVIFIDLRETYTAGPIIALLDWLVDALAPSWRSSWFKRASDHFVAIMETVAHTKIGQMIRKVLEPPGISEEPRDDK